MHRRALAAFPRFWELIVINNGSDDGTADYLANLCDAAPLPVTVIANTKNIGFPAAINQGLRCARGEFLVLLNNDVVVTDGWLEQLVALTAVASGRGHENRNREPKTKPADQGPLVSDPYPGRDITVIDLVPGMSSTKSRRTSKAGISGSSGPCPTMPRLRSWSTTCRIAT